MAKTYERLTARGVSGLLNSGRKGKHSDGQGLFLHINDTGARWAYLYRWAGRPRELGLGSGAKVTLAEARERAEWCRKTRAAGQDPKTQPRPWAPQPGPEAVPVNDEPAIITFGRAAEELISSLEKDWRNPKHRQQWENTLKTYCASIWNRPVAEVDTDAVLTILNPAWKKVPETAARVRGRLEHVLDYAKVRGWRQGENPARWRGHLQVSLKKRKKLSRGHHRALPYAEVPAFMAALREVPGEPAAALEFAVLTAARSGEVMGATWGEFDLDKALWTVPANRMKGGREHRVPLSPRALELLRQRWHSEVSPSAYVFRGRQPGSGLSVMALAMVLRRMGDVEAGQEAPPWAGCTVHGFRSSFKDWTAEETNFGRELSEAALAHLVGDEVERAYRRGDALEKRRALMLAWERYCNGEPIENVVMLPRSAVA